MVCCLRHRIIDRISTGIFIHPDVYWLCGLHLSIYQDRISQAPELKWSFMSRRVKLFCCWQSDAEKEPVGWAWDALLDWTETAGMLKWQYLSQTPELKQIKEVGVIFFALLQWCITNHHYFTFSVTYRNLILTHDNCFELCYQISSMSGVWTECVLVPCAKIGATATMVPTLELWLSE